MAIDHYTRTVKADGEPAPYSIYKKVLVNHYEIYLNENISDNGDYNELFHVLRSATKNDYVELRIACRGGLCSTGFQLVNAIRECDTDVHVIADGECYSMASILALAGSDLVLNDGSFLMFHNYSTSERGKGKETVDAAVHYYKHFQKQLERVCAPFLTKHELQQLADDKDVYITADQKDIDKRIKRHFKDSS